MTTALAREDLFAQFAEILNEVAGVPADKVTESARVVDDLDVDSLAMVEVAVACEERFGVKIEDKELEKLESVGDVLTLIQSKL